VPCHELVFVPRTPTSDEDDGWLLAYVHDDNTQTADVEIWESRDFTGVPVALVHLPQRVPFGFHGNWVPDSA
jgi:carotenoid cleavage dioxygenase